MTSSSSSFFADEKLNGNGGSFSTPPTTASSSSSTRTPPFLPTRAEALLLFAYPALLSFGTLFSLLSPQVRNAPYDPSLQAHSQDPLLSPSYFARKSNIFNVYFVKRGWAWVTLAFLFFLFHHPATASTQQRTRGLLRWGLATLWWLLVTQWCFGPAIIDRSFRFTGGKCELVDAKMDAGLASGKDIVTGVACKAAGGQWQGGHDISGHVFLLVLGSYFLVQEVGWVVVNHWRRSGSNGSTAATAVAGMRDDRSVVMGDGAIKSATVEAERVAATAEHRLASAWDALAFGGKIATAVIVMSWWMLLMTAIFFHTWFEKFTGLCVALVGLYGVYFLPRFVPLLRATIGLPGI
ncbi:inositol phospholipid synthesis and fat-storage-inducing TM-domain-containing protein [Coniella lustricola]|uniref:Acyl-coenzyme A diphosphatase SCS3 n=1 Tax=Coniella lustricola TaxID=2025994 RepID=A0A2T3A145_9PEZI|nr:inositol phospholipid synthesis and fat-storage-inducing TM-domain-containing protein [Coniella lustricola]